MAADDKACLGRWIDDHLAKPADFSRASAGTRRNVREEFESAGVLRQRTDAVMLTRNGKSSIYRNRRTSDESDAALARNTAMPPKSSMAPQRPAGVPASARSQSRDLLARTTGEIGIDPTWQHRIDLILSFAHAVASDLVSCTIRPCLRQAGANGAPKIDIIDPMLMISPPPPRFICA
jgi:hypothetical protein